MRKFIYFLMLLPLLVIGGEDIVSQGDDVISAFESFTGQVEGSRIRVRLRPDLASHIVCELSSGDLVAVVGEDSDFYAIKPFTEKKAYIFRTYVLDDVVEGSRVNVRLEPTLNAPIISQLNTGDAAEGEICGENNKWLEIAMPEDVNFYVANDYVTNVGDPDYLVSWERRRGEVMDLFNEATFLSGSELCKEFSDIDFDMVKLSFSNIIDNYSEFGSYVEQSEVCLEQFKDDYLKKKLAFLEQKVEEASIEEIVEEVPVEDAVLDGDNFVGVTDKMMVWEDLELMVYSEWLEDHPDKTLTEYYQDSLEEADRLTGIVEPYNRVIKNKPGDYILRGSDNLPIAYLYSTKVNLDSMVGCKVDVLVSSRENNSFAFPAYFVLEVE